VPFQRPLRLLRLVVVGIRFWTEAMTVLRERTFSVIGTASVLAVGTAALLVYLAERGGDGSIQTRSCDGWTRWKPTALLDRTWRRRQTLSSSASLP
jgi:hypothetical protein